MKIEIVTDDRSNIAELLVQIANTAGIGHSFWVVIDPGDPDFQKAYGVDGDGAPVISQITVNGRDKYRLGPVAKP